MQLTRRHGKGRPTADPYISPDAIIAPDVEIDTSDQVNIMGDAIITENTLILTHDHEPGGGLTFSPITIREGAFIGARSIILQGCSEIGTGAYVGAGSVVTKDIPAHELWAGNPARKIRDL